MVTIFAVAVTFTACSNTSKDTNDQNKKEKVQTLQSGNTMGNLQNDGLVATNGENILYNNSNGLFKNSIDGGNKKLISSDYAEDINILNGWIYYYSTSDSGANKGLWKITTDGEELTLLRDGSVENLIVDNEWIYFIAKEGSNDKHRSLHKMSIEDNRTIEVIYSGQMEFLNISDKLIVLKYQM